MPEHGKLQIYISVKKPLSYGTVFLHNPSSPYRSHQAWDLKRGCFFLCRIPYAVPCCLDLLFTHSVTNVTHSLGLGLRVFRPVLPVSLPFSRGSVPTLFDSTIYLHFNIFFKKKKIPTKLQPSRFQRPPFPLEWAYKYAAWIFVIRGFKFHVGK